jgi:glutathione S-transferase
MDGNECRGEVMAKLEIIGFDISNWVRAARIACEEKGVPYELTTNGMTGIQDLKSAKYLALHPFGRIPAMRHGDVVLFETAAIGRYVDATLATGPFLHGATPYLDDFILLPMTDALMVTPEGPELLAAAPNVARHRAGFRKAAELWCHDAAEVPTSGLRTLLLRPGAPPGLSLAGAHLQRVALAL